MTLSDNPVVKYLREAREELKKVTWPTQKETIRYTGIVIAFSLVLAVFIGLLDFAYNSGLQSLIDLSGGTTNVVTPAVDVQPTTNDISDTINIETEGENAGTVTVEEGSPADDEEAPADEDSE